MQEIELVFSVAVPLNTQARLDYARAECRRVLLLPVPADPDEYCQFNLAGASFVMRIGGECLYSDEIATPANAVPVEIGTKTYGGIPNCLVTTALFSRIWEAFGKGVYIVDYGVVRALPEYSDDEVDSINEILKFLQLKLIEIDE